MTITAAQIQAEKELEEIELLILNASDLCDLYSTEEYMPVKFDHSNTIVEKYYAGSIGSSIHRGIKAGNVRKIIAG